MTKREILLIPISVMPYYVILALACLVFSSDWDAARFVMEDLFFGDGILYVVHILLVALVSVALSAVYIAYTARHPIDALRLARLSLIIKLCQIPAFITVFIVGALLFVTVLGVAFVPMLALFDYAVILCTGGLTSLSVILAGRQYGYPVKQNVWVMILQGFFCLDVIASLIFYLKLKRSWETV